MRRSLNMRIEYCRKIFASWLRQSDIEPEIIDRLSGSMGKNIFLRHYYRPSSDYYKGRVLALLKQLLGRVIPEKRTSEGGTEEYTIGDLSPMPPSIYIVNSYVRRYFMQRRQKRNGASLWLRSSKC
jgi:hypothetical protein